MNGKQFEFVAFLCVIILIKSVILLFAWNNCIPMIFTDAKSINFQQSICLVVIATCLFQSHRLAVIQLMLIDFYKAFFSQAMKNQPPQNGMKPKKTTKSIKKTKKFKE